MAFIQNEEEALFDPGKSGHDSTNRFKSALDLGLDKTVKVVVVREGKILLVHELGKPNRKPPGWGLPGGGIFPDPTGKVISLDELRYEIRAQISELIKISGIDLSKKVPDSEFNMNDEIEEIIFLVALKEVLEETHLFVLPRRIMFRMPKGNFGYENVYIQGELVDGTIIKSTSETDDCDFFPPDMLPNGLYPNHAGAIYRALYFFDLSPEVIRIGGENFKDYIDEHIWPRLREQKNG